MIPIPDNAEKVLLPDGTEAYEVQEHYFISFSERGYRYKYSVDVSRFPIDYWGRVLDIKMWVKGEWKEMIALIQSTTMTERLRRLIERGWEKNAKPEGEDGTMRLAASGYLKIYGEMFQLFEDQKKHAYIKSGHRRSV